MDNETLTTSGAAQLCNVSRFTIRNWVESGKLKSSLTAGGHRRIAREDLLKFMPEKKRAKDVGSLKGEETEKNGDMSHSWEDVCRGLDSSTAKLMGKLRTCSTDELDELQAKIKALEKCKRLTSKVILNLTKVKEVMNSVNH